MANNLVFDEWRDSLEEMEQITVVKSETFSFVWTISNFGEFMERKYEFSSPLFSRNLSSGVSKWKMIVYPQSKYPEGTYVTLRLLKLSEDDKVCSVIYNILLNDANGTKHSLQTREKVFRHSSDFDECLVASSRTIIEKCFLQNGSLIITCKLDLLVCENQGDNIDKKSAGIEDSICKTNNINVSTTSVPVNDLSFSKSFKKQISEKDINVFTPKDCNSFQKSPAYSSISSGDAYFRKKEGLEILSNDLKHLYNSKDKHDVTIYVDDGKLHAHKAILMHRCDYFKRVFSSQYADEITISGISVSALDAVLYYLYSGILPDIIDSEAVLLLKASSLFNLHHLIDVTQNILKSQITVSNVLDIFRVSTEAKADALKNKTLKFVAENQEKIMLMPQWNQMLQNDPHTAGEILLTVSSFQNRQSNVKY